MAFQPRTQFQPSHIKSSSLFERILLVMALLALGVGLFGLIRERGSMKNEVPVRGGTYSEGIVADSPTKVERIVSRLTSIGLTYRDRGGAIQPALARSWEVSEDKKTYTFHLAEGINAQGLLATIQSSKTSWDQVAVSAPTDSSLRFVLQEPLSLFLSTTTAPLFPYGPYELVKRDKREISLRANPRFVLGEPYIQRFILKIYEDEAQLVKAAKDGDIDGSADFSEAVSRQFVSHEVELPRYQILFFNMTRPSFRNLEDRQRIVNVSDGPPVSYTLLTSQTGMASELADRLTRDYAAKNVTLNVVKKPSLVLQKEEIAKREYDLLLYGVDYGVERDYYPFWHSSQIAAPGLNISGVKEKELDTLLETARREPDGGRRLELNRQIEDMLANRAYQKVIYQEKLRFWSRKSIRHIEYGTIDEGVDRFNLVWRWYLESKKSK